MHNCLNHKAVINRKPEREAPDTRKDLKGSRTSHFEIPEFGLKYLFGIFDSGKQIPDSPFIPFPKELNRRGLF